MAIRPLPSYPCPNERGGYDWIGDIDGPASYNNTSSFPTSGQQFNAIDFGMGGFEIVDAPSVSNDGANEVVVVLGATIAGGTMGGPPPAGSSAPAIIPTSFVFHWYAGIRGIGGITEVNNGTNLSTKYVRTRISFV